MVRLGSLLLLLQLAWAALGDLNHPACNNSNNLYLDKIVKIRTAYGSISIWDVNDVIVLDNIDRKGTMNLVVTEGTQVEQKYVDERILKMSVDNRVKFAYESKWNSVEINYQTQRHCSEDGVHHMHFEVTNSLRNSSNELVLKYRQVCNEIFLKERHLDLNTAWVQDAHCPGPLNVLYDRNKSSLMYRFIYDRNTRLRDLRSDSDGHVVYIFQNGDLGMKHRNLSVQSDNTESLFMDNFITSSTDSELSFGISKYYAKKAGIATTNITRSDGVNMYSVPYTIVPGFTDFWNSSALGQTDLSTGEVPSILAVMHYDPVKNVGVQFNGPDGNNVFRIQKEFKEGDEIAVVVKKIRRATTRGELQFSLDNGVSLVAWPYQLNYHSVIIPYHDLLSINQLGYIEEDQTIKVELIKRFENKTQLQTNYKLEIIAPSPVPPVTEAPGVTGVTGNPEQTGNSSTETPETSESPELSTGVMELYAFKSYSLGNDSTILTNSEEAITPDSEGVYHVYKDSSNFAMVFTIKGTWKELRVQFEDQSQRKVSRKLKAKNHTWKLMFKGSEGPHKLIMKNAETGEKKEYPVEIHFNGKSFIHPPDN